MTTKVFRTSVLGTLLFCLLALPSPSVFGQTCGGGDDVEVELTGIGEVTVNGVNGEPAAKKAYKQALADAAEAGGLASCSGTCTLGTCTMSFDGFSQGSSMPDGSSNGNGGWTFDAPSNGDLEFSVACPCVIEASRPQMHVQHEGGSQPFRGGDTEDQNRFSTSQGHFDFFPNPTKEQFNIRANFETAINAVMVQVSNMQGQLVSQYELGAVTEGSYLFQLETQDLNTGIYFATVYAGGEILARSRVVIQH